MTIKIITGITKARLNCTVPFQSFKDLKKNYFYGYFCMYSCWYYLVNKFLDCLSVVKVSAQFSTGKRDKYFNKIPS